MTSKRIIVLGAGLTGLSVAWHLQKSKASCEIFEKEIEVGGLCRSQKVGGFTFDYTGHLLHFKNPGIFSFIKKLLGNNLAVHKRSSWVYFSGRHIPYPFQANLHGLPPAVIKECLLSLIGVLRNKNNHVIKGNFSDWIDYNLGRGIARYFMRPYNSKFWTIPCDRLSCDWHNNIVPQPSPSQIIEGALGSRAWNLGYNSKFWYPVRGGIEVLPLAIDSQISNVHTESEVKGINIRDKRIVTASGKEHKFDYLVSTIPLPELHKLISVVPHRV
ncbi:MAG: FAD-dependent oxidoreductase, partial [Candidatus Omnitrophica bacterium]|nr:FAD-dependent oxidoreductase [Candidatus Omnitrophota bacterium]